MSWFNLFITHLLLLFCSQLLAEPGYDSHCLSLDPEFMQVAGMNNEPHNFYPATQNNSWHNGNGLYCANYHSSNPSVSLDNYMGGIKLGFKAQRSPAPVWTYLSSNQNFSWMVSHNNGPYVEANSELDFKGCAFKHNQPFNSTNNAHQEDNLLELGIFHIKHYQGSYPGAPASGSDFLDFFLFEFFGPLSPTYADNGGNRVSDTNLPWCDRPKVSDCSYEESGSTFPGYRSYRNPSYCCKNYASTGICLIEDANSGKTVASQAITDQYTTELYLFLNAPDSPAITVGGVSLPAGQKCFPEVAASNSPPVFNSTVVNVYATVGEPTTFYLHSANDPDGDALTYEAYSGNITGVGGCVTGTVPGAPVTVSAQCSYTPTVAGSYNFKYHATDSAGNDSTNSVTVNLIATDPPPGLTLPTCPGEQVINVALGSSVGFDLSGVTSNNAGETFEYYAFAPSMPPTISGPCIINPALITYFDPSLGCTFTPTTSGEHYLQVSVQSNYGADVMCMITKKFIVAEPTNSFPYFTSTSHGVTTYKNQAVTFTLPAAFDADGDTIDYRIEDGLPGPHGHVGTITNCNPSVQAVAYVAQGTPVTCTFTPNADYVGISGNSYYLLARDNAGNPSLNHDKVEFRFRVNDTTLLPVQNDEVAFNDSTCTIHGKTTSPYFKRRCQLLKSRLEKPDGEYTP